MPDFGLSVRAVHNGEFMPVRMVQRLSSGWWFAGLRRALITGYVLVAAGCASPQPGDPTVFQPVPPSAAAVREPPAPPVVYQSPAEAPLPPKPKPAAKPRVAMKPAPPEPMPVMGSVKGAAAPYGNVAETGRVTALRGTERRPMATMRTPVLTMAMAEPREALHMDTAVAPAKSDAQKPEAAVYDGSTAYYVPLRMVEGKASLVHLWLDRKTAVADLQQALAGYLQQEVKRISAKSGREPAPEFAAPGVAAIEGKTVLIGDTMIAHLRGGDDFDIDLKEPVTQSLKVKNRAEWRWRVTPKRASEDGVPLILDVWIDPGYGRQLIESFHEQVYVTARPRTWYEIVQELDKWLVLLGLSGVGGVAAWLWKWLLRRRGRRNRQADPPV